MESKKQSVEEGKKHPPLPYDSEHSAIAVPLGTRIIAVSDLHIGISHRKDHGGGEKNAYTDKDILNVLRELPRAVRRLASSGKVPPGKIHVTAVGDIFEPLYHRYEDKEEARGIYVRDTEELVKTYGEENCHLHLVGGNHDDGWKFIKAMRELEEDRKYRDNFSYHPVAVRIGALFATHGDLALRSGTEGITVTERVPSREKHIGDHFTELLYGANQVRDLDREPGLLRMARRIEARVNASGAQRLIQKTEDITLPQGKAVARIWEVLVEANKTHPELLDALIKEDNSLVPAVKRVVTGHTHIPYTGVMLDSRAMAKFDAKYLDVDFDNTGTALLGRGERFNPLCYTTEERGISVERLQVAISGSDISIAARPAQGRGR